MEEKKKGNKLAIVIIILLLIIILILGGILFIKRDAIFNNDNNAKKSPKIVNNETKEEKVSFTDEQLQEYIGYIDRVSIGPNAKIYKIDKIEVSTMSGKDKIEYVGKALYEKHSSSSDFAYDYIEEKDVKARVEKVYGPNTYEEADFNLGCGDYTLDKTTGRYYSKTGCGGTTATQVKNTIVDYNATKTRLEITTAYVFHDGMTSKLYKDFDKTIALGDYTSKSAEEDNTYLTNYTKTNKDKLNNLIYVFESKDGTNYYFKELTNKTS